MSEPSSQPTVPEIVQCADELYDGNKMRDGLNYLLQYKDMEDIEVEVNVCIIDMQLWQTRNEIIMDYLPYYYRTAQFACK